MNVGELIELLSNYEDDLEVRLATQPSWPFEYSITDVVSHHDGIVYVAEGRQIDYLNSEVVEMLGWRR